MLIDTHCHLDDDRLYAEAQDIIKSFADDGLYAVVSSSSNYESCLKNFKLATENEKIYATVGVHPQEASSRTQEQYDEIVKMAADGKVIAVGEIGLDYYYEYSPREMQKAALVEQMELASYLKLPAVFHVRDAFEDFLKIITDNKNLLNYGGVVHCYSGSAEYLKTLCRFNFYFGFDGPVTYKNARHSVESLLACPREKILFETDAPYLTPVPFRGQTNYPKYVKCVAEKAAELLKIGFDEISAISTDNAKSLYRKIK